MIMTIMFEYLPWNFDQDVHLDGMATDVEK